MPARIAVLSLVFSVVVSGVAACVPPHAAITTSQGQRMTYFPH